jgi:hypothetical protein
MLCFKQLMNAIPSPIYVRRAGLVRFTTSKTARAWVIGRAASRIHRFIKFHFVFNRCKDARSPFVAGVQRGSRGSSKRQQQHRPPDRRHQRRQRRPARTMAPTRGGSWIKLALLVALSGARRASPLLTGRCPMLPLPLRPLPGSPATPTSPLPLPLPLSLSRLRAPGALTLLVNRPLRRRGGARAAAGREQLGERRQEPGRADLGVCTGPRGEGAHVHIPMPHP